MTPCIDLTGRAFVVTGGTQGLGEDTALHMARCGAAGVTICGRNEARGAAVARTLRDAGCEALFVRADLERAGDCHAVIARHAERFDRLDGLANVAASTARGTLEDTTAEAWDRMFALNARAPFLLMQGAVAVMKRAGRGGSIVNVLSVSAHGGQPFITAYCASKGALATLTKNAANALRRDRIRVNGLNIGWMATPAEDDVQRQGGGPADWLARADAAAPFGRILRTADVAKLVCYLMSDDAALLTGSLVDFDQDVIGAWD
jgi:NAD(P)-dependent dehydrogenase (short-subunit alcohol dehydrogenase family)